MRPLWHLQLHFLVLSTIFPHGLRFQFEIYKLVQSYDSDVLSFLITRFLNYKKKSLHFSNSNDYDEHELYLYTKKLHLRR